VQFLFKRVNLSPTLVALKNSIQSAAAMIKTPKTSWISGAEHDRRELHGDWYGRSGERMKRIDTVVNMPHVLLAIQGMWVGDPRQLSTLPFKDCYDEFDRLGTFIYKNPWMLVELVERRMVEDVSPYIMRYARSRLEPPSFLITQEEVAYYLHLPIAKTGFLKSLKERTAFTEIGTGGVEGGGGETADSGSSRVLRLAKVPDIQEPLKDEQVERLALLPSPRVRGFEVVYDSGSTSLLFSARSERDAEEYLSTLESVYGKLSVVGAPAKPDFLGEIPRIVGLKLDGRPQNAG
jgi:hypothetical protein